MTIDSAYWPEKRNNHGGTVYQFDFEIIDPSYLEVFTIDATGLYLLADPGDYTVTIGTFIAPISKGGRVTFNDPLDASVVAVSIQRKSDITDEQEFTTGQPFNAESFEFQCDKLTMILQEINAAKCDCSSIVKSFCRAYSCDAWAKAARNTLQHFWACEDVSGGLANSSLIPGGSGLIAATSPNGPGSYDQPNIIPSACAGARSVRIYNNAGWLNASIVNTNLTGGVMAGYVSPGTDGGLTICSWRTSAQNSPGIELQKGGPGIEIYANLGRYVDSFELIYASSMSDPTHLIVKFDFVQNAPKNWTLNAEVWRNGVSSGPISHIISTAEAGLTLSNFFSLGAATGSGNAYVSQFGFGNSSVSIPALLEGYARQSPYYVDPDPACFSTHTWTPAQIPTYLRFDASNAASITESAGVVTTWANIGDGPSAYDATNSTAGERPSIIASALNGLPVIRFDGTTDNLEYTTANDVGKNTGSILMLAVAKEDADNTGVIFGAANNSTVTRASISMKRVGGRRLDADAFVSADGANSATAWGVISGLLDSTNADARLWINGALESENLTWQTPGNTSNTTSERFRIGANPSTTPANYFDGDIAEIIVLQGDANTTTANRQLCEGYLAHKWGLEALLPSDHPYKDLPP